MTRGRNPQDSIDGTLLNELLAKYGLTHTSLTEDMAIFLKQNVDKYKDTTMKDIRKKIKVDINGYAFHSTTPKIDRIIIMLKLIGCTMEELLLTLQIEEKTKALIQDLSLNVEYFSDSDLELMKQGLTYKCLELSCNFQFHAVEKWLNLSNSYKVIILKNDLTELKDIIWHGIEGNLAKSICLDIDKNLIPGSSNKEFNIESTKPWWRSERIEFTTNLFFREVNFEDSGFFLTKTKATESLKISGTILGLDESTPVKLCEHINDSNYMETIKSTMEAMGAIMSAGIEISKAGHIKFRHTGRRAELFSDDDYARFSLKEKNIMLDETSSFQYKITPLEGSVFQLYWG